ncbi:SAF domain-containing protein [Luteipulveratus mongoliensis]|uniref:SAF domain-containing protein n=1 Tax=Luteipulveratus mongoliensis TaxID=571913 RepID=A0A0K1JI37_9MICO|nr:SAF domain-containing protein [Luteipulveratus mongoliensis]AKU16243.1 hypothetical protein VV02_10840 [Luteipulveratus mongoliensis]
MGETRSGRGETALPRPAAQRLQKPSWRDSRLVIGVLLIVLATVGGATVIQRFDNSVEVLQASRSLVPGQPITKDDVRTVRVRIDRAGSTYVSATRALPTGRLVREVRPGELLPRSAIGSPAQVEVKAVSVRIDPSLAAALVPGSIVDVWVSAKRDVAGAATYAKPTRMIERAVVSRVPADDGRFGIGSGQDAAVHVLVPKDRVAAVIGAVNTEAKVTLVPTADSPLRKSS